MGKMLGEGAYGAAIDYSVVGDSAWKLAASNSSALSGLLGTVDAKLDERKKEKDDIKTGRELAKAMAVIAPEMAGGLNSFVSAMEAEDSHSGQAALGRQIKEFIGMGLDKQRSDALLGMQVRQLGLDERRVKVIEDQAAALPAMQQQEAESINTQAINEALSIITPLQEMEAPLADKLPNMDASAQRIADAIQAGDGATALSGAKEYQAARLKQMEPYLGPEKLSLQKIGGTDESGRGIDIDAFVSQQGDVFDLNRQPLNDGPGVLPPRPGTENLPAPRRVQPMPKIGIKPSGAATVKTPTEQALDEVRLQEAKGKVAAQETATVKEQSTKQAAMANAQDAVNLMERLEKHPGFEAAVGSGFSKTLLRQDEAVRGSDRAGAEAIIKQLQGQAFLNSIQQLRGLGALSDAEGAKLQQAAARLDPNQSEADFKAALADYKSIVRAGIERAGGMIAADEAATQRAAAAARLKALQGK